VDLAELIDRHRDGLIEQFGHRLLPSQRRALDAIQHCRREQAAQTVVAACSDCGAGVELPLSCGHRACPRCQHHLTEQWLARQTSKLLPTDYFLVTTTLPSELRGIAYDHQRIVYDAMFRESISTAQTFASNDSKLRGTLGITAVLHTHARDKAFHPHVHMLIPAAAIDPKGRFRRKRKYLFNHEAFAKVFRPRLLQRLASQGLILPATPPEWIVDVTFVGSGHKALEYLARYLYRGVIAEHDILHERDGVVTFRYRESETRRLCYRALPGPAFLFCILQHVLPRRFRRPRDYGLLHHSSRVTLQRIQLQLMRRLPQGPEVSPPVWQCRQCKAPMRLVARIRNAPPRARDPPMTSGIRPSR